MKDSNKLRDIQNEMAIMQSRNRLTIPNEIFEKLTDSPVVVIGIGGVGSVVAEQLVRLGLRKITIAARGCYELGNLNRQIPATYISVISKTPKLYAMSERLYSINPYINITPVNCNVAKDYKKLTKMLKKQDIKMIFNCVDEYLAQKIVAKISEELEVPMILGGVTKLGLHGIVTTLTHNTIEYSKLFRIHVNEEETIFTEKMVKQFWFNAHKKEMPSWLIELYEKNMNTPYPVLTPVPWIIASISVMEFIKYYTKISSPVLAPKAIYFDATQPSIKIIDLEKEKKSNFIPWRP